MQCLLFSITTIVAVTQVIDSLPVGVTVGLSPRYHPIESLYQAQDNYGQYVYGYATPTISKTETKSADGVTRGGYSYIDSNGYLQTVEYTADALHGFRVAATNLPRDLPDVAYAKAKHLSDFEIIKAQRAQIAVAYSNPVAVPISAVPQIPTHQQLPQPVTDLPEVVKARNEHLATLYAAYNNPPAAPQPVQDLPEVAKARAEHLAAVEQIQLRDAALRAEISLSPVPDHIVNGVVPVRTVSESYQTPGLPIASTAPISYQPVAMGPYASQIRSDGSAGQYTYGYVGPLSAHSESRSPDGVTRGGYSYIDANGVIQTVQYISDAEHGFRVAASNIPVDIGHSRASSAGTAVPPATATAEVVQRVKAIVPNEYYNTEIVY